MLDKIYQYDGHFERTGEARMQILDRRDLRLHRNEKYASEDIWGKLSEIKPEPGKTIIMVLAMSANEYYGPNRNGDAFSEGPVELNGEMLVKPGEELPQHHKSFEDAHFFRHHVNKDPMKAMGDVIQSAYNWMMHRVELLCRLDNNKARDTIERIEGGAFPGVSMGCKIDYDVCSICGNKAPTRQQYCDHVNGRDPRFGMNKLLPNGQRCYVYNPSPRFFDISEVFKPADRIGYTIKKVAYTNAPYEIKLSADLGAEAASLSEKRALLGKMSVIDKVIKGIAGKPEDIAKLDEATRRFAEDVAPNVDAPMVDEEVLRKLSNYSIPEIMSSFSATGMAPSTPELFVTLCAQRGLSPTKTAIAKVAQAQGRVVEFLSQMPQVLNAVEDLGVLKVAEELVRPEIVQDLLPYQEKRALYREYLARRYVPESYGTALGQTTGMFDPEQAYYEPTQSLLHFQDPGSGQLWATTRDAAEQADWANTKKQMAEAAGLAGLLGAAYKTFTAGGKTRWLAPAALAGSGVLGYNLLKRQRMPQVHTLEGELVPANTEFVIKQGSASRVLTPIAGGALATLLMAQDFRQNPYADRVTRVAWENPVMTGLGATAAAGGLSELVHGALRSMAKGASYNPTNPGEATLDDVVQGISEITFPGLVARS
jgi:hypothetical protein